MSHKKRDWSKYNKSLINRGSLTFWIDEKALKNWKAKRARKKKGRPFQYSDLAITAAATIRYAFKLSLRACEGFLRSLLKLLHVPVMTPSYTQVCRRMKLIDMSAHLLSDKPVAHVVLDATGLKVFGEGEWKVKKHGVGNRRQWRKLHLAVDEETQEILFADLTNEYEHDTKFIPEIVEKRKGVKRVVMDGAADSSRMYKLLWKEGIDLLTPPQKNARKRTEPWFTQRNNRLLEILGLGGDKEAKSLWGKLTGYSKRVTVESAIAKWKKLFGYDLRSRDDRNQRLETNLKSHIINRMISLEKLQA